MKGIYADVRHSRSCPRHDASATDRRKPAHANGRRACRCSPTVRIRLRHGAPWWRQWELPNGWEAEQLEALVGVARAERQAIDAGLKVAEPRASRPVPTVAEWGQECLDKIKAAIDVGDPEAYSNSTWLAYRGAFRKHVKAPRTQGGIGDLRLTAVTYQVVDDHRRKLLADGLGEATAAQVIYMLSGMFKAALEEAREQGWPLERNPAKVPPNVGYGRRRKTLPRQGLDDGKAMPLEVARELLRRHAGTTFGQQLLTALTTGMRQAEIAGLQRPSLYLARRRLYVENQLGRGVNGELFVNKPPKYESYRWVPIYSPLAAMWMPYDGGSGYVFTDAMQHADNAPWQVRKMSVMLAEKWDELVAEHPELPLRHRQGWHACRHLYSNLLDRAGVREKLRKAVLGHTDPGMKGVYLEVADEELDAIEPVLDRAFGDIFAPTSSPVTPPARSGDGPRRR